MPELNGNLQNFHQQLQLERVHNFFTIRPNSDDSDLMEPLTIQKGFVF